jgi:hypothetical protein
VWQIPPVAHHATTAATKIQDRLERFDVQSILRENIADAFGPQRTISQKPLDVVLAIYQIEQSRRRKGQAGGRPLFLEPVVFPSRADANGVLVRRIKAVGKSQEACSIQNSPENMHSRDPQRHSLSGHRI